MFRPRILSLLSHEQYSQLSKSQLILHIKTSVVGQSRYMSTEFTRWLLSPSNYALLQEIDWHKGRYIIYLVLFSFQYFTYSYGLRKQWTGRATTPDSTLKRGRHSRYLLRGLVKTSDNLELFSHVHSGWCTSRGQTSAVQARCLEIHSPRKFWYYTVKPSGIDPSTSSRNISDLADLGVKQFGDIGWGIHLLISLPRKQVTVKFDTGSTLENPIF